MFYYIYFLSLFSLIFSLFLFIPRHFRILVSGDCDFLSLLCCTIIFIEKKQKTKTMILSLHWCKTMILSLYWHKTMNVLFIAMKNDCIFVKCVILLLQKNYIVIISETDKMSVTKGK